jgi:hypothetical protein
LRTLARILFQAYWEHLKARAMQPGPPPDASTMAQGSCVVRTEHATLEWVTVTPEGEVPFVLRVDDAAATVLPGVGTEASDVAIRGVLSFFGRSHLASFGVDRGVWLADGRVRTGTRTRAVPMALEGRGARVDLLLADDVTAKGISLPCTSLHASAEPSPPALRADVGVGKELRNDSVQLFARANGSTPIDLKTPFLPTFETAGGRLRVAQRMDDGGQLRGWVPAEQLLESEVGGGQGYGIGGSACGCPAHRDEARIRVAVSAGVAVFSRAGGGRWAAFTRPVEANATELDADWLRLEGLPGVTETYSYPGSPCDDVRAFVRHSDARIIGPERPRHR